MDAIAVIGPWRGGTSLVTAVLEALGVFVGDEFVDARTGYCTFEDVRLREACLACFDERPGRWCYYGTREERVRRLADWVTWARRRAIDSGSIACGGKHPLMCKLVDELSEAWSVEDELKTTLIAVVRSPDDIHRSWTRRNELGTGQWWPRWDREYVVDDLIAARDASLAKKRHIQIDFDSLRRIPGATIEMLASACSLPTENVPNATDLVKKQKEKVR